MSVILDSEKLKFELSAIFKEKPYEVSDFGLDGLA